MAMPASSAVRCGQLARSRPLQEEVEIHVVLVVAGEGAHRQIRWRLVGGRPLLPVPHLRMFLAQVCIERLEVRVVEQAVPARGAERVELLVQAAGRVVTGLGVLQHPPVQRAQHREPRRGASRPVDQGCGFELSVGIGQAAVGNRLARGGRPQQCRRVDHRGVEEQPARWGVR
jgi:hypothetical protein